MDLGNGWKARAALELVGNWAENKTTLPDAVLNSAAQLFQAINRSFHGAEENSQKITR